MVKFYRNKTSNCFNQVLKDIEKAQFGYEVSQSAQQLYFRF